MKKLKLESLNEAKLKTLENLQMNKIFGGGDTYPTNCSITTYDGRGNVTQDTVTTTDGGEVKPSSV